MESIWTKTSDSPRFPTLNGDAKTDVLIIGGGLAGILTAYYLKMKGIDYILVEKDKICSHTTANTTAKITAQHSLCYHKILKSSGENAAELYLKSNLEALAEYERLCKNIKCDFVKKDNFVYSMNDEKILEKELDALHRIGYKAFYTGKVPLPVKTVGAVGFRNQAQFHPLKFVNEISKNLNIYEGTRVLKFNDDSVITTTGKISFNRAVVATHFPFITNHGAYFLKLYQHRSYVIAYEGCADVGGMYIDESGKGFSFRNYGNSLLIGGGSHRTGKQGGNWTEIRNFAKINYPQAREATFWATQDCMSLDSMPYIGQYSKATPNIYVATGFNKWGMTGCMVSALLLSDLLSGKNSPYAGIYNPSRSILKPQLFVNGFESAINLLTPTTKRCPHLGCALKWNSAEHSWDCPCHGSRFTENGKVLDNPANGNIK